MRNVGPFERLIEPSALIEEMTPFDIWTKRPDICIMAAMATPSTTLPLTYWRESVIIYLWHALKGGTYYDFRWGCSTVPSGEVFKRYEGVGKLDLEVIGNKDFSSMNDNSSTRVEVGSTSCDATINSQHSSENFHRNGEYLSR